MPTLSYEKPILIRLRETAIGDVNPQGHATPPPVPSCANGSLPSSGMILTVCDTGMTAGMSCTQGHGIK